MVQNDIDDGKTPYTLDGFYFLFFIFFRFDKPILEAVIGGVL